MKIFISLIIMFAFSCGHDAPTKQPTERNPFPLPQPNPKPQPQPQPQPKPQPKPQPDPYSCIKEGGNLGKKGQYQVRANIRGQIKTYEPVSDCKKPVVAFNNGTGAQCLFYRSVFENLASHGYFVACYESTMTGNGNQCLKALQAGFDRDDTYIDRAAVLGHSQGGGATIACLWKAEKAFEGVYFAGIPMQPAIGMNFPEASRALRELESPTFFITGDRDTVIRPSGVARGYSQIKAEKFWYECRTGCTHFNVQEWTKAAAPAYFNWKLFGHDDAMEFIQKLPQTQYWRKVK